MWVAPMGRRGRSDIVVVLVTASMVVMLKWLAKTKQVPRMVRDTPMKHLKDIVVHKRSLSKTTPFQSISAHIDEPPARNKRTTVLDDDLVQITPTFIHEHS